MAAEKSAWWRDPWSIAAVQRRNKQGNVLADEGEPNVAEDPEAEASSGPRSSGSEASSELGMGGGRALSRVGVRPSGTEAAHFAE